MAELNNPKIIKHDFARGGNNNGGGNMNNDDYVTRKEFQDAVNKLDKRFDQMDSRFTGVEHDINNMSKILWWIMGLVGAGIIVPLLAFVVKAIIR
ncbi:hypothetical protein FC35_GL000641 [Limosilactobacillus coleohominis DSM 14060]|nr:hypothetical protein FC35_GL000641 [Limosilactobacillus coleohominis DSM 14060]DAX90348.1 MAG TPA: hemolysin [Caudoviricetes sp.]